AAPRPHMPVNIDEARNDRLSADIEDLRSYWSFDGARRPDLHHTIVRDDEVAFLDDVVIPRSRHRHDPGARQHDRSMRVCAWNFDDRIEGVGLVRCKGLTVDRRSERPDYRLAIGSPRQVLAAFTRQAFDRNDRIAAAANADLDDFLPHARNADDDVLVL